MARKKVPDNIQVELLTQSARRCCLCFGIDHDYNEKSGQIAHLDNDPSNNKIDNLVWLCLKHHDKYDSSTSQSKNYTIKEVIGYRNSLYEKVNTLREAAFSSSLADVSNNKTAHIEQDLKNDIRELLGRINPIIVEKLDKGQIAIPVMISLPKVNSLQQLTTNEQFSKFLKIQPTGSVNIGFNNQVGNSINDLDQGYLQGYILYPTGSLKS